MLPVRNFSHGFLEMFRPEFSQPKKNVTDSVGISQPAMWMMTSGQHGNFFTSLNFQSFSDLMFGSQVKGTEWNCYVKTVTKVQASISL